jgi:hypothetical protein
MTQNENRSKLLIIRYFKIEFSLMLNQLKYISLKCVPVSFEVSFPAFSPSSGLANAVFVNGFSLVQFR